MAVQFGAQLANSQVQVGNSSNSPYWSTKYTNYGGFPARGQINNINGSTQGNYGCFTWCQQNADAFCNSSALLGVMSVSNLNATYGKSGGVQYNSVTSNSSENYVVQSGDTVRLDWACQPSQTLVLVDGGTNNCPYAGRVDYGLANNVVVSGPEGVIYSGANVTGSKQFTITGSPGQIKTYTTQCKKGTSQTWTTSVPVVISSAVMDISANPQQVSKNQSSRISWNVSGVNLSTCTLSGPSGVVWSVTPQTTTYSTPGSYSFVVPPSYSSIVATVKGAGGGGGGSGGHWFWPVSAGGAGTAGSVTRFNSTLTANGGGGGGGGCSSPPYHGACGGGSAGTASGGSNNVTGGGNTGGAPGTSGFCYNGGQGQSGGYTKLIYTAGQLSSGAKSIVIGSGGAGGVGASGSCGSGQTGSPGSVTIDLYPLPNNYYDTPPLTASSTYTLTCTSNEGVAVLASTTVAVLLAPQPTLTIAGNGTQNALTVLAGTPVNIVATYAAGSGDALVRTALNDNSNNSLPGVAWTPPTTKNYTFTPTTPGTYVFYPAVQTGDYPSWSNYGKSLTITVIANTCGTHEIGTPPNCVCEPGYVKQGTVCVQNPCPGNNEVPPTCTCATGYVRSGGICVLPATVDIKANGSDTARVQPGSTVKLTWSTNNIAAGSCTVKNASGTTLSSANSMSAPGLSVVVNAQTSFTLRCNDQAGVQVTDTIPVTLIPRFEEI